jgi:hypothetical protein
MRIWLKAAAVALAALVVGCGDHQTQSVHLPLAVGNLWVYDVEADSLRDTARLEVVGEDGGVFALAVRCTTGHWGGGTRPRYLSCRDSALWVRDTVRDFWAGKKAVWTGILSDDPRKDRTQTMLVCRGLGRSRFSTRSVPEFTVGADTYRNCLALHGSYVYSYWALFLGGNDSFEIEETYCPDVGLVSFEKENHWSGWWYFGGDQGSLDSGVYIDRWRLRSYSLCGQ